MMIRRAQTAPTAWDEATELEPRRGTIGLSGLIDGDVAALFGETLAGLQPADAPVLLDLTRARVEDPRIARAVAEAVRQATVRLGQIRLLGAPTALREALAEAARDTTIELG